MSSHGTRSPHMLDGQDQGYDSANFTVRTRAQDDAFVAAMRKAIRLRKVKGIVEGFKVTEAGEARVLSPVRAATFVPTMSMLENS